jgi:hypothetical protein
MSVVALRTESRQPAKSAGDALIEAIADAVALRLERMAAMRSGIARPSFAEVFIFPYKSVVQSGEMEDACRM